jgi:hypothetical protein
MPEPANVGATLTKALAWELSYQTLLDDGR